MAVTQRTLRVGTRGSQLALEQAHRVIRVLQQTAPEAQVELRIITTAGDVDKHTPLTILGGRGVFAKEIEIALHSGEVDLAVHSAKDLTSTGPEGLTIGAVLDREDPRDALISPDGRSLAMLASGARVGTSSRRRMAQLCQVRADLQSVELRGNIDTRLRKVREGQVDAAILAAAGVLRMGWSDQISEYLSVEQFVPAPGQGALAVQCRADDRNLLDLLQTIDSPADRVAVETERAFLRAIGGGCQAPIGAYATVEQGQVTLRAMFATEDLGRAVFETRTAPIGEAPAMAYALANEMGQVLNR